MSYPHSRGLATVQLTGLTWQVFDINTAQVAQGVLVVEGMVAHDAVVFAGQVVEAAMHRGHTWQIVQHLLHLFNEFLHRRGDKQLHSANSTTVLMGVYSFTG